MMETPREEGGAKVRENVEEPLQLIDFVKKKKDETSGKVETEITLNYLRPHPHKQRLNDLFEKCGDRPLCIYCVCGQSRRGKSFLLGYMIRCLECLEKDQGDGDWMGWEDKTKPLEGFRFRGGVSPETQGIWVWSRPFIVKTEKNKEVAVILMDTQGTQDEFTTTKDMSAIVGLSLLMSSNMIFNFFNDLQEDTLTALNTYMQYGMMALENNYGENSKPFQKLTFLIRDWNSPSSFKYGVDGGNQYLQEKLELKETQPAEAQQLRTMINKCFKKLDCFLMPHIGEKAKEEGFTGSVAELAPIFAKKMEEFINNITSEDGMEVKEVMGNLVTAGELKSFLEMYVDAFNSTEIFSPSNVLDATSKVHNEIQVRKALRKFEEQMKKKSRGKRYLSGEELEKAYQTALGSTIETFQKMKKFGTKEIAEDYERKLRELIAENFRLIQEDNEGKRSKFIEGAKRDAISGFKEGLETEIPLPEEDETLFYEEATMKKIKRVTRSSILSEFEEKVEVEGNEGEEELQKLVLELNGELDILWEGHVNKNRVHRGNAEKKMAIVLGVLVEEHRGKVSTLLDENKFKEEEEIRILHEDVKQGTLESFKDTKKPGGKEFHKKYSAELETQLQEVFEQLESTRKVKLGELWEDIKMQLKEVYERYKEGLQEFSLEKKCTSLEHLEEAHSEGKVKAMMNIVEDISPYPEGSKWAGKLEDEVEEELEKIFEIVKGELEALLRRSEEAGRNAWEESIGQYKNAMRGLAGEDDVALEPEELLEAHTRNLELALEKFRMFPEENGILKVGESEMEEKIEKLRVALEELYFDFEKEQKGLAEIASGKAKNLVSDCLKEYERMMKDERENNVRGKEDMERAHGEVKKRCVEMFKRQYPLRDAAQAQEQLEGLIRAMDLAFEDHVELFELRSGVDETKMQKVIMDAREIYMGEMEKHVKSEFFVRPDHLEKLHENGKLVVLSKLESKVEGGLTKAQKEEVEQEMEALYRWHEMKNKVKLNSAKTPGRAPAIGIDLGTTYSCAGVFYGDKVHIVPNHKQGNHTTTPSYIAFNEGGKTIVGWTAKENAYRNPNFTLFDVKRIIGKKADDEKLLEDMKRWPFNVRSVQGIPKIEVPRGQLVHPEQVSAELLKYMKEMAEDHLKLPRGAITKAVVTIPAHFNDGQRMATKHAAEIAGLQLLTILNEPTAAAIAYSLEKLDRSTKPRNVLIYDLGGGTFDCSILKVKHKDVDVLGVDGDPHLGGVDFDKKLVSFCVEKFKQKYGINLLDGINSKDIRVKTEVSSRLMRIQGACEKSKKDLTTAEMTRVHVSSISNGRDLDVEVTREAFERMNEGEFQKSIRIVERALGKLNLKKTDIDDIVLVGGSSMIPRVQQLLQNFFKGQALNKSIHADHAVAYGAAVQAAMLNGEECQGLLDFTQIQDVTPLSLGIRVVSGEVSVIIPKNTKIPVELKKPFTTVDDNQTTILVKIYQGENRLADDNELLGEFTLKGIPPLPKEEPKIDVTMEVDSMGILHVEAVCLSSNSKKGIVIEDKRGRMSREEIVSARRRHI